MSDQTQLPDDDHLLDVAVAIADGAPIDWPAAATPDAQQDALVARLRRLERLVRGHEAVRSTRSPSTGHETVLTEARRRANSDVDRPLQVRWGPLIVLEKIGRGSFGDVYRAWDPHLDREVALKLIPEAASETARSPVVEEGRLLARVRHPNVLTVHGAERVDGRVGIWTEYVHGETLADEIARRGPLSADEASRIGIEICRALEAVHAAGLLHRDVKAQNVLRDGTGRIVLGDFGTGVALDEHAGITEPQIAGTPLYLAPEIVEHAPASVRSDLYSLGVLLYFLVTANYPVRGGTVADIRRAHAARERISLRDVRSDLPERFVDIVEAVLAAEPSKRFHTASALESALLDAMTVDGRSADVHAHSRRTSFRIGIAVAVTAVIVAGTVSIIGFNRQQSGDVRIDSAKYAPVSTPDVNTAGQLAEAPAAAPPTTTSPVKWRLNAGDWVLVASFDNETGEAVLDETIEAALKRELEYSEYVRVAQRDRWEDVLRLLGRPLDTRLAPPLARDVCLRDGSIRGLITGRVEKLQSRYTITLSIVDPVSGAVLATLTEGVANQAELLAAVRRQALGVRSTFGETQAALNAARDEMEHVRMPALAALSFQTKALARSSVRIELPPAQRHELWGDVERLLRDAVREDPMFAHAWIMLAWSLLNQDRPQEDYLPYARRAFDLAETATPQERYFILGSFHAMSVWSDGNSRTTDNPQELERARSAYEALFALQPDHYYVLNNLQRVYAILGRDRELALMRIRLAEARPANVRLNLLAAAVLVDDGNLAAARRLTARAEAAVSSDAAARHAVEWWETQFFRAYLDWVEEKPGEALARASRLAAAIDRAPEELLRTVTTTAGGLIATPRTQLTFLYLALGRLHAARDLAERDRVWEGRLGTYPSSLGYALREQGDLERLRDYLATQWTFEHASSIIGSRVEFLVPAGRLGEAEREADRYRRHTPEAALGTSFYPFITGMVALGRDDPREAVRVLEPWLEAPNRNGILHNHQWPAQKLAEAWDALGETARAISVLERTGERPPALLLVRHMWLSSKAQLASLYRKNGQDQRARALEDRLRKLLAVADADHPLLEQLRARH